MAAIQSTGTPLKKRNNYKLLVDPELKKGHKKLYRLNGRDEPGVSTDWFGFKGGVLYLERNTP